MALSGKLDEVGEADRWIWERLGHIWERLGCWTGSSQQPRRLIKTQILLAENLLEQGVGGALSNGIVGFIAVAAGMTGDATAADMTAANTHLRSLRLLCAARPDRVQPAGVHVQGEDQREDARRNRRAARSQARGR